jgi:hypothetical protein
MFSHWISSSVKNIQALSGLTPYLLAMTIKERDVFFHWISSSVKTFKPIRAWQLLLEFLSIYRDSRSVS